MQLKGKQNHPLQKKNPKHKKSNQTKTPQTTPLNLHKNRTKLTNKSISISQLILYFIQLVLYNLHIFYTYALMYVYMLYIYVD